MKIFVIKSLLKDDYDTIRGVVVIAENEDAAYNAIKSGASYGSWKSVGPGYGDDILRTELRITEVGTASDDLVEGVLLTDYHHA